jgi:hypothetical protein
VAMPEQLPQIAFGWCRNPDSREAVAEQKFENERSVARKLLHAFYGMFRTLQPFDGTLLFATS